MKPKVILPAQKKFDANTHFGARAYDQILKVTRTIADLFGSENILSDQYRSLDRQVWT